MKKIKYAKRRDQMKSKVGNKNEDGFELECIVCGGGEGIALIAHRNKKNIVGFIAVCQDHLKDVYGAGFNLMLPTRGYHSDAGEPGG